MSKIDWQYWMGWIVAWAVTLLALLALAVHTFFQHDFCTGEVSEQCAREWLSATGGWAAIPAAVLTVFFLSQQISKADRHHRQLVLLQTSSKLELAQVMISVLQEINDHIIRVISAAQTLDNAQYTEAFDDIAAKFQAVYRVNAYDECDRLFLIETDYTIEDLRRMLAGLQNDPACFKVELFKGSRLERALRACKSYNDSLIRASKAYIAQIDSLLA